MIRAQRHLSDAFRRQGPQRALRNDAAARRAEVARQAFLLLGGRVAAARFLYELHSGLGGVPMEMAMTSPLGKLAVSSTIQRLFRERLHAL